MGTVDTPHNPPAVLNAEATRSGEKTLAKIAAGVVLLGLAVSLPLGRLPVATIPASVPIHDTILWLLDALTAALLFAQSRRLRSRAVLALGAGYLFNVCMVVAHALLGADPGTGAWLINFWQAGFPCFVIAYAALVRRPADTLKSDAGRASVIAIASVLLLAAALSLLVTHAPLAVVWGANTAPANTASVNTALCALTATALLLLWRSAVPTVLELWLMVVMVAWLATIIVAAVAGPHGDDIAFYASQAFDLLAAACVLGALLWDANRLHGTIAEARALAETRDSELARSREEFSRVQRFEAIGQLIGGVAHDFNNLLTVMTGAIDLSLRDSDLSPASRRVLEMAMLAARRGEKLTSQLLTFARRQVLRPEVLNPNEAVASLESFIARTTGETIRITTELSPVLWPAYLDRAQFETALLNLVLNARDALDGMSPNAPGTVVIGTSNATVAAGAFDDVPGGDYVLVKVTDAGVGMTPEVLGHAIEPFFTTKGVGKGSGLGLSQVYGFVKGASGHVRIESTFGEGTTVELYLPKTENYAAPPAPAATLPIRASTGHETVLVVEDDPDVLNIAVAGLLDLGYHVKTAADAQEGLAILRTDPDIDVLFSDVVMPGGMNGAQLAVEARRLRPGLKVLLTSGYTATAPDDLPDQMEVLPKPYRRDDLASMLRLVIGQPDNSGRS